MDYKQLWDNSFIAQEKDYSYNSVPPEAIVRTVSYHLRSLPEEQRRNLRYLDMGCGAGSTLLWLAERGIHSMGVDISPKALELAIQAFYEVGYDSTSTYWPDFHLGSATSIPKPDESFDGIVEANVFQHLGREDRDKAFAEVRRLLKPGGIFVGYDMAVGSTPHNSAIHRVEGDPGSFLLGSGEGYHVEDIGLTHFFSYGEYLEYLRGFRHVDSTVVQYQLPVTEMKRRYPDRSNGHTYAHRFYCTFAIK